MKKLLISLSVLIVLFISGCAKHTIFSNIQNTPSNETKVAIVRNDNFLIKHIQSLNNSTGELEGIFHYSSLRPGPHHKKFILKPGIYDIYYSKRTTRGTEKAHGEVKLKAGHSYQVNYEGCYGLYYKKICIRGIWFEDLTTGELLSGYKHKIISSR